jgi:PKD repeat protein
MDIRNNLFYYEGTNYAIYTYNPTVIAWDYNNYMMGSGTLAYISGSTYSSISSLAGWSASHNQNNFDQDPNWIDKAKNHHLGKKFPELFGPYLGLYQDIDGDSRCHIMSALGPDEYNGTTLPPKVNFGLPDTAWVGSPTQILNAVKPSKSLAAKWYVNGKLTSTDFHLTYTPKKAGKDEIKLVLMTCSGSDSLTKSLFVSTLVKRPVADFNASKTEVYTGETVNLIDLSQYGPTSHAWGIGPFWGKNPSTAVGEKRFAYVNGTDSTDAFPSVSFQHPGYYRVSLKATNKFGNSTKARNNFITVRQNAVLCSGANSTTGAVGTLFDDGGKDGKYKAGTKICTYTITSCEGTPVFSIGKFDLNSGDFLRVYDGADDTGKPLWDILAFPKGITGGLSAGFATNFTATTGTAFVEFETDANTQTVGEGFEIDWYIKKTNWKSPNTNFNMPDTACVGYEVAFENTTTGIYKTLKWDVFDDGSVDATGPAHAYTFTSPGTYKVALTAEPYCTKPVSKSKKIVVINATKKPKPNFKANFTKASVGYTVKITDLTRYCADYTKWEIKPPYYVLAKNGSVNDRNIEVLFGKSGVYTVKLTKGNSFGNDTLSMVRYIHVLDYCRPAVANLTTDLGISRVAFNTIDNRSEVGTEGYTYYQGISTTLDRGVKYPIVIERANTLQAMSRKVWIDWNMDGDFDDTGELVAEEKPSNTAAFTDSILISASTTPGMTRMRISTNYKDMKNLACGPHQFGEFEDYNLIISDEDRLAPSISLFGPSNDTILVHTSWAEPGYKAFDILDGDITKQVAVDYNSLDTARLGAYVLTYTVKDGGGNTDQATRTIWVVDKTDPTLTLIDPQDTILQIHHDFVDPGAIAYDNYDTSLYVAVANSINNTELGKYAIQYCVTDLSDNGPTCLTRWVRVVDTLLPTIALNGNDVVQVEQCHYYTDAGYVATDNDRFVVSTGGTWTGNTEERGSFTVVYTVTDMAGNTARVTRTIEVVDTESPEITLLGAQMVYLDRWATFTDPGYSVSDYCNEPNEVTVTTGGTFTNTQSNGLYTITYTAKDLSGNVAPVAVRHLYVQQPLGIEGPLAAGLSLFPNPVVGGAAWLGWQGTDNQGVHVTLTDVAGHTIRNIGWVTLNGKTSTPLDLDMIAPGSYFLHCQVEGYPYVLPIVLR